MAEERPITERGTADDPRAADAPTTAAPVTSDPRTTTATVRERRYEEFGGFNWGAAFFGWLVATGLAVLLVTLLGALGTAIGLSEVTATEANDAAETIGIVGAALFLIVLFIAYYAGGYVAGRMSRFDGGRQGLGVWVFGVLVTILLAVAGVIFGSEYNLLAELNLPRIPIDEGDLTTGGLITLAAIVIATLVGALAGGKFGQRYHDKVDRAGA